MFHTGLIVQEEGMWCKRSVWSLMSPLMSSAFGGYLNVVVPKLFYTDFASVPRHFGLYELWGGRGNRAAAVHDYLYRKNAVVYVDKSKMAPAGMPSAIVDWISIMTAEGDMSKTSSIALCINPPREVCDNMLRQLLIEDEESIEIYDPMFAAVRLGGGSSYHIYDTTDALPCDKWDILQPEG